MDVYAYVYILSSEATRPQLPPELELTCTPQPSPMVCGASLYAHAYRSAHLAAERERRLWIALWQGYARHTGHGIYIRHCQAHPIVRLVADLDGTLVAGEGLVELSHHLGLGARMARLTEEAMRGGHDFVASFTARTAMLHGLSRASIEAVAQALPLAPGADRLAELCRRYALTFDVATSTYQPLCLALRERIGFGHYVASIPCWEGDRLSAGRFHTLIDEQGKQHFALEAPHAPQASPANTLAIGDGANDRAMLATCWHSLIYCSLPHPSIEVLPIDSLLEAILTLHPAS